MIIAAKGESAIGMERREANPIFQIGFNKCGTKSIHHFLLNSGVRSLHWARNTLGRKMSARIDAGEDPIQDFPTVVGFTDMMAFEEHRLLEPYKRFDYLHHWYPDALFILNTWDRERWIASRMAHEVKGRRLIPSYARVLQISEREVPDYWRFEWDAHHSAVRSYFTGASNFLEFDIECDEPDKLARFIGSRFPRCLNTPFVVYNSTPPERRSTGAGGTAVS